jgi:hypothetical protein
MRARKYNKKIEVYQSAPIFDGYSGNSCSSFTLLFSAWCQIKTLDTTSKDTNVGEIVEESKLVVNLRKNSNIDYTSKGLYFKYRNIDYIVQGTPINIGFEDREIQVNLINSGVIINPSSAIKIFDQTFGLTFN